jgi:hypothetical protein
MITSRESGCGPGAAKLATGDRLPTIQVTGTRLAIFRHGINCGSSLQSTRHCLWRVCFLNESFEFGTGDA